MLSVADRLILIARTKGKVNLKSVDYLHRRRASNVKIRPDNKRAFNGSHGEGDGLANKRRNGKVEENWQTMEIKQTSKLSNVACKARILSIIFR